MFNELLIFNKLGPGATPVSATIAANQNKITRNPSGTLYMLNTFSFHQAAGKVVLKWNSLRDAGNGLIHTNIVNNIVPLRSKFAVQTLDKKDPTFDLLISGSATGTVSEMAAVDTYGSGNLDGFNPLYTSLQMLNNYSNLKAVNTENAITTSVTGDVSALVALNAAQNPFLSDRYYVLLGYNTNVKCLAVVFYGQETGNLYFGGPGDPTQKLFTQEYFARREIDYKVPSLLVVDGNRLANGMLKHGIVQNDGAATVTVTSFWMELRPGFNPMLHSTQNPNFKIN